MVRKVAKQATGQRVQKRATGQLGLRYVGTEMIQESYEVHSKYGKQVHICGSA
jgi:hypothetical protein